MFFDSFLCVLQYQHNLMRTVDNYDRLLINEAQVDLITKLRVDLLIQQVTTWVVTVEHKLISISIVDIISRMSHSNVNVAREISVEKEASRCVERNGGEELTSAS